MAIVPKLRIVSLSARLETSGSTLRLSYRVVNDTELELGLLDRVPIATDITRPPGYQGSNAYLGVEGTTLVVRKALMPIPPGLRMSERVVPGITKLGPRAVRDETVGLSLPIRAFDPNRAAKLRLDTTGAIDVVTSLARTVTRARVIIGYFVVDDAILVPISPSWPDVFRARPPTAPVSRYEEAHSEVPVSEALEALEYEVVLASKAPS